MAKRRHVHRKKKGSLLRHSKTKMNGLETRFSKILIDIVVKFKSQYVLKDKIYDFYLPEYGILIEVDGDYYHCNPRKYPRGAINKMQRKNIRNDNYKDSLAKAWGFQLIRVWEYDINNMGAVVSRKLKLLLETKKGKTV